MVMGDSFCQMGIKYMRDQSTREHFAIKPKGNDQKLAR